MDKAKKRPQKDLLFHALASMKRLKDGLGRSFRYSYPHPEASVLAKDLARADECNYTPVAPVEEHFFSVPEQIDPRIRYRFEQINRNAIPERFILELKNGRVFGEGHVITANNQLVSDVSLYFSQHDKHWLLGLGKLPEPVAIQGSVAVIASPGSNNYFHWTLETLPRINLLKKHLDVIDWFYIGSTEPFQQVWLEKVGIPKKKILRISPQEHLRADRLLVPSFSHKSGMYTDAAYEYVRSFCLPLPIATRKIYISRSSARRRRITNETVLLPLLKERGYEVHRLAGMTVDEQMKLFGSASHIISAHGAELTNLTYCQPGTKVLEIFSPYYINPCFWIVAMQVGLTYFCSTGLGGNTVIRNKKAPLQVWRNINIDLENLTAVLENFMSEASAQ